MVLYKLRCATALLVVAYVHVILTDAGPSPLQTPDVNLDLSELQYGGSSCPDAELIKPCLCSSDDQFHTSMYCSEIENEDQLRDVFSNDFPVMKMTDFQIICKSGNSVERLQEGDLGNVTFKNILIADCGLTEIEEEAIAGSYETLELLSLQENKLTSIPDLSKFQVLKNLYLVDNELTEFPNITSESLVDVNLSSNNFSVVPEDIVDGMTALEDLYLYDLGISHIEAGIFTKNEKLSSLNLSNNNLTSLPINAVKVYGDMAELWLSHNQITKLLPGSFSGINFILDLRYNLLTEFEEDIFRELLEERVDVMLEGNPLGCGCDIAWLIINGTLLDQFFSPPTCADGTSFLDLDPTYYEENC